MKKKRLIALIIILIFAVFVILFWYTTVSNRKKETKSSKNTSSQKLKFAVNKPDNQNTEPVLTASQQIENRQRQAIINFYSNYPKNADDVATTSHLTKLGSPTLLASYKAKKTANYNPLFCGLATTPSGVNVNKVVESTASSGTSFAVQISSDSKVAIGIQVSVIESNSMQLIDFVGCPGPI